MNNKNGATVAPDKIDALVIGAGPAGLMAADVWSAHGRRVSLVDAMPSIGRKFLMAGKSGLNLTKNEPLADFLSAYPDAPDVLLSAIRDFGPEDVVDLAADLKIPLFTGSTGRVFPKVMKASPFLRAWIERLTARGVDIRTRWRWQGWEGDALTFETPEGLARITSEMTLFALGGASWKRLGSDGAWATQFREAGIEVTDFAPANVGFEVPWSDHMERFFGEPVKGTALSAGSDRSRGEWVITARGIEGGGIYTLSRQVREGADLALDLMPDRSLSTVVERLSRPRGKASTSTFLRKALGMSPVQRALLMEWGRPLPQDSTQLANLIKSLPVHHNGPMPMDGAISTAGGVSWDALDGFALRSRPDTYIAGEMLDWEAPTGGYLITGCFATGRAAALQALGNQD